MIIQTVDGEVKPHDQLYRESSKVEARQVTERVNGPQRVV